jgi:hypothetical protein
VYCTWRRCTARPFLYQFRCEKLIKLGTPVPYRRLSLPIMSTALDKLKSHDSSYRQPDFTEFSNQRMTNPFVSSVMLGLIAQATFVRLVGSSLDCEADGARTGDLLRCRGC